MCCLIDPCTPGLGALSCSVSSTPPAFNYFRELECGSIEKERKREGERERKREIGLLLRGVIGTRDLSVYLSSRKTGPLNHGGMREGGKGQGRWGGGGGTSGFSCTGHSNSCMREAHTSSYHEGTQRRLDGYIDGTLMPSKEKKNTRVIPSFLCGAVVTVIVVVVILVVILLLPLLLEDAYF